MNEYTNIYYFEVINKIGGIETFFYQLAKKYQDKDLTIVYKAADNNQIKRLQKYVRCVKYKGQHIKCKRAFFNFNLDIIDNVEAEEYILVIHGDYEDQVKRNQMEIKNIPNNNKITRYIAVSKQAAIGYKNLTGKDCEVYYNPYTLDNKKPILKLISATRLGKEKGFMRMVNLMNKLDKREIPYLWFIFTDEDKTIKNDHVIIMKPTLNIERYLKGMDYLIQLSDNEGYCYSVVEALSRGIPVVVTPCPVFKEIGLNDNNSIAMNMDCSNIDEVIDDMVNKEFNFTYKPKEDNWDKLLGNEKSTYKEELKQSYKVEATKEYERMGLPDRDLQRVPKEGEQWEVDINRLMYLLGDNKYNKQFVRKVNCSKKENMVK